VKKKAPEKSRNWEGEASVRGNNVREMRKLHLGQEGARLGHVSFRQVGPPGEPKRTQLSLNNTDEERKRGGASLRNRTGARKGGKPSSWIPNGSLGGSDECYQLTLNNRKKNGFGEYTTSKAFRSEKGRGPPERLERHLWRELMEKKEGLGRPAEVTALVKDLCSGRRRFLKRKGAGKDAVELGGNNLMAVWRDRGTHHQTSGDAENSRCGKKERVGGQRRW